MRYSTHASEFYRVRDLGKTVAIGGVLREVFVWDFYLLIVCIVSIAYMVFLFVPFFWWALPAGTVVLFFSQLRELPSRRCIAVFVEMGAFLAFFDFAVESIGSALGLWYSSGSTLMLYGVPLEVTVACFFGGTAWALFTTSTRKSGGKQFMRKNRRHAMLILFDVLFFGIGGSLAEQFLILSGLMHYASVWTGFCAALSYMATWLTLNLVVESIG
jgi:hypothetical protein